MRIHSDKLDGHDLFAATADIAGVYVDECNLRGSRSRARAFEVRLAAHPAKGRRRRNTGQYGAEGAWEPAVKHAATYDEHGWWMAELYKIDPNAIVAIYKDREDFHRQTGNKFNEMVPKEHV